MKNYKKNKVIYMGKDNEVPMEYKHMDISDFLFVDTEKKRAYKLRNNRRIFGENGCQYCCFTNSFRCPTFGDVGVCNCPESNTNQLEFYKVSFIEFLLYEIKE